MGVHTSHEKSGGRCIWSEGCQSRAQLKELQGQMLKALHMCMNVNELLLKSVRLLEWKRDLGPSEGFILLTLVLALLCSICLLPTAGALHLLHLSG